MQYLRDFLHRRVSVESLCLYRVCFGALIFVEALSWLPYTRELFSNEGYHLPNVELIPAPSPTGAFLMVLGLAAASLCLSLGLFTRAATAATLFFWSWVYCIDSLNEKAAQCISLVVLVVLLFSPCANRLSVDNLRRRRSGQPALPGEVSIFQLRFLQLEFMNIYFFSGVAKMMNPEWVSGSVFYRVLNGRLATPMGVIVSSLDSDLLARAGGLGTILFELFESFFLLLPFTRPAAILVGINFHIGIQTSLYIGTLGTHFLLALLLLFPDPESVKARTAKLLKRFA